MNCSLPSSVENTFNAQILILDARIQTLYTEGL